MIEEDEKQSTLVYFDNVIIGWQSLNDLQIKASRFEESMKRREMRINDFKIIYGVKELDIVIVFRTMK